MIERNEMTAPIPAVGAAGEQSSQICTTDIVSEAAAENKPEIDTTLWFDGKNINEAVFCADFLTRHRLLFSGGSFFTTEGRVVDETPLRREIFEELKTCAVNNIPRKISNILEIMKLVALREDFAPEADRIHVQNGTLLLDGTFMEGKPNIVRNRLPVLYRPDAPEPTHWLAFLDELLYPEDIPTLQEFVGYCLIPSNKGQRMMIIKGNGGEGKSQIGTVLSALFGCNMKDGSIGKISENRFARADLEHVLLCVDDDMCMDALRQTNYVKSLVTAQGKMDLEKKGKQSYQGWMYARLLAFSNGDLQALFDRSDGFYRRQLVLETREKPEGRVDDPHIAEKMHTELEGIFLWAFAGLQRLVANNFSFSESERARENRESVKRGNNNLFDFMDSDGYIRLKADSSISSKELYEIYRMWCEENSATPLKARSFSDSLITNRRRYNLEYCNNITNAAGRRVRGFMGIEALVHPYENEISGFPLRTYAAKDRKHRYDGGQAMKTVQIPYDLFVDLVLYHLRGEDEAEEEIRQGLEQKLDAMLRRQLYSQYKTAPTEKQREQARQEYLDHRGVPESYRWSTPPWEL